MVETRSNMQNGLRPNGGIGMDEELVVSLFLRKRLNTRKVMYTHESIGIKSVGQVRTNFNPPVCDSRPHTSISKMN